MVNITRHTPTQPIPDPEAMRLFERQWALYRKIVDHDYLYHREAGAAIRRALAAREAAAPRLLELACGDASMTVRALTDLPIAHYHGVDLSAAALDLAAANLERLGCDSTLDQRDYVEAMQQFDAPVDVVLISLSLHHLETDAKGELMRAARCALGADGLFLVYEPASPDGEDREGYMERFERTCHPGWSTLTAEEWRDAWDHVRENDLVETASAWLGLGQEAGFSRADPLFVSPDDLYRMFRFRP